MKGKIFMATFTLLGSAALAHGEPLGFQGVKSGMTTQEVKNIVARNGGRCNSGGCSQTAQIRNNEVTVLYLFDGDTFDGMNFTFRQSSYPAIKEAIIEKWGSPARSEKREWKNRVGGKFDNERTEWVLSDGTIELNYRGQRVTESSLDMKNKAYFDRIAEKAKEDKKAPGF